jgi:predicted phage tail protein
MQQVVRLLGDLGERYGAEHTYYDLRTPADAIKLLCINRPDFQEELIHAHEHGVGYRLIQADLDLGYEDLHLPLGSKDLILAPVIAGSGGDTGAIVLGIALIGASLAFPGGGLFGGTVFGFLGGPVASAATLTAVGTAMSAVGASLVLGGISAMLSPQPTLPNLSGGKTRGSGESGSTDGPQSVIRGSDGRQSYMFSGAVNSVGVGATIPVVYGEVIAGSHLLSARIEVTDESDPLKTAIRDPGPDTVTIGGEEINGVTYASGLRFARWSNNDIKSGELKSPEVLTLSNSNTIKLDRKDYETSDNKRENYMILFEVDDGLFNFVSGPGTTLVDGFITFEVSMQVAVSGPNQPVSRVRTTIQGLLKERQEYKFIQYISYPELPDDLGPDGIEAQVTIIDFDCADGCNLKVRGNGYKLTNSKATNEVPLTT